MTNVLGLIGLVVFIVCIIGLAAAVTWAVVKASDAGVVDALLRRGKSSPARN